MYAGSRRRRGESDDGEHAPRADGRIAPPVASSLQEAKRRERRSLFRRQLQRALRGARCARREEQREEQREQSARATARLHPWQAGRVFFFFRE